VRWGGIAFAGLKGVEKRRQRKKRSKLKGGIQSIHSGAKAFKAHAEKKRIVEEGQSINRRRKRKERIKKSVPASGRRGRLFREDNGSDIAGSVSLEWQCVARRESKMGFPFIYGGIFSQFRVGHERGLN